MNPTMILGAILLCVIFYVIYNLLFVKSEVASELKLNSTETILGTDIIELENKKYSDYTHSFFIFLIDVPDQNSGSIDSATGSVNGHSLVERIGGNGDGGESMSNGHFQVYINEDHTKIVARAYNTATTGGYNGVQHIGIKYQKHVFVTVVVKRNTIDLYLDGRLVSAGVFENENKASFYNQDIHLSKTKNFQTAASNNLGFLHSYQYTDRALTADEIAVLYNNYVQMYSRNSTTDYSGKISLTRNGDELTNLTKTFSF